MAIHSILKMKMDELEWIGEKPEIQGRLLKAAHVIAENSDIRVGYVDDWEVRRDYEIASITDFIRVVRSSGRIFSTFNDQLKISFVSADQEIWEFELSKIALLQIEEEIELAAS